MKHYDNSGTLASFETEEEMLKFFPDGLNEIIDLDLFVNPPKTYEEELVELNSEYASKMQILANEYNIAVARNGATEKPKVAAARQKITDLDAWYSSENDQLLLKYFS